MYKFLITALTAMLIVHECVCQAADAETNLLATNPSFEDVAFSTNAHGAYAFVGWTGNNYLYNGHRVVKGDATDGSNFFHMDWAGTLATAAENRPTAKPGTVYEMRYDLRTLLGKYPQECLGTQSYLDFFDASGNRLKSYWGPDWLPQVQDHGPAPWETIVVRGVAPKNAVTVGVRVVAPSGVFHDATHNYTENRHIEVDNFRLCAIAETSDRLAVRRFPHLVEPGKTAHLAIDFATVGPRLLSVRLLDKTSVSKVEEKRELTAGRGLECVDISIPPDLAGGDYVWEVRIIAPDAASGPALKTLTETGIFCDETVSLPADDTKGFPADDSHIIRMGRWNAKDPKHPWCYWFGSEIRVRFNGTSLALLGSAGDNGYGGPLTVPLNVVIDGDETKITTLKLDRFNGTFPVATGLPDGVHTATIFKASESMTPFQFDGLVVDAGHGLLRPEPLPARRLEIYGDSVTSGGSASPAYLAYAPMLGRELNADVHIISKGGTGVAASFSHMTTLLHYWNLLDFTNVFDTSKATTWDFSKWTPDAVLITIGHNDQFNGGGSTFAARYGEFVAALRHVYPQTPLFCANTVISANVGHFEGAILPLVAKDPKINFAFQLNPWVDPKTGHPPTEGHAAMVHGDKDRFSLADWIEAGMGWGIDPAPNKALAPGSTSAEKPLTR